MATKPPPDLTPIRAQVYKDPRPKEHFDRFHQRTRSRPPDWVYEVVRIATSLYAWTFFRARGIDAQKVPASGPVILAPNHFSFMDHFFAGAFIRRRVNFMAKSQLFVQPMQFIYTHGGVFPVRRGHQDEEAFLTANGILERGGAIVMYSEGGRSRTGQLSAQPKRGIGRLALESGAPVVPVAIHGSSRVRNWKRLQFPKVRVRYGDAIRWPPPTRSSSGSGSSTRRSTVDGGLGELQRRALREGPGGGRQRRTPSASAAPCSVDVDMQRQRCTHRRNADPCGVDRRSGPLLNARS